MLCRWDTAGKADRHPVETEADAGHPGLWGETAGGGGDGALHGIPAPAQTLGDTVHSGKGTGMHTLNPAHTHTTQASFESLFFKVNISLVFLHSILREWASKSCCSSPNSWRRSRSPCCMWLMCIDLYRWEIFICQCDLWEYLCSMIIYFGKLFKGRFFYCYWIPIRA